MKKSSFALSAPVITGACLTLLTMAAHASPLLDGEQVYGAVSAGIGLRGGSLSHDIQLSGPPVPIRLSGTTSLDRDRNLALTLGRQWHAKPTAEDVDPRRWRLEAQLWTVQWPRDRFQAGRIAASLNDNMDVNGLYAHALTRVWRGDQSRLWVGAGLGYARVSLPDASATSPGCGCLAAASGNGASWRLMAQLERSMTESSALFAGVFHTSLPKARTAGNALPSADIKLPAALELQLGLRVSF